MNRDNLANIIGVNSANNLFDSSLVTSNEDGSVIERMEFLQAKTFADKEIDTKSVATVANGQTSLFTFTKSIRIHSVVGRITTPIQAQATAVKLQAVCDALAAYDICGTKDVNAFVAGTLLSITGTAANGMVAADGVGAIAPGQANPIDLTCVTSGIIKQNSGAASSGAITWQILWEPLEAGATVTPA